MVDLFKLFIDRFVMPFESGLVFNDEFIEIANLVDDQTLDAQNYFSYWVPWYIQIKFQYLKQFLMVSKTSVLQLHLLFYVQKIILKWLFLILRFSNTYFEV